MMKPDLLSTATSPGILILDFGLLLKTETECITNKGNHHFWRKQKENVGINFAIKDAGQTRAITALKVIKRTMLKIPFYLF